jgi:DNA-binding NtrC family response regulator
MKILIVENEVYLAQSISSKLAENGYACEIAVNMKDALKNQRYDAVLLSTNIAGQNFYPIIEKHKSSIIILMISYVSSDTVLNPIKAGASDYIQKPFMMEELLRKLQHLRTHNTLLANNKTLKSYVENLFENTRITQSISKKLSSQLLIKSISQNYIDAVVFKYAKEFEEHFEFISMSHPDAWEKIGKKNKHELDTLIYITNLQDVKIMDKAKLFNMLKERRAILSSIDLNEESPFECMTLEAEDNFFNKIDILTVDNYIKSILTYFQGKLPDTELSRKLGISRKNIWERRKRYGITK